MTDSDGRGTSMFSGGLDRLRGRSRFLMLSLVAMILLYPLIPVGRLAAYLVLAVNTLVLIAAVYTVGDSRKHIRIAISLAIPQVLLATVAVLMEHGSRAQLYVSFVDTIVLGVFYGYVIRRLLTYIAGSKVVTGDTIYSGVSVYLLLGLIWSTVYAILENLAPNSFDLNVELGSHGGVELIYFSFVTMTTLGYGDITPLTDRARSFAILQTVSGQLYLGVMIAWLVSRYRPEEKSEGA